VLTGEKTNCAGSMRWHQGTVLDKINLVNVNFSVNLTDVFLRRQNQSVCFTKEAYVCFLELS